MPKLLRRALFALALPLALTPLRAHADDAPYDLIIRNGHIIDGTGSPWYSGDIGIRNGHIAAIGFLRGSAGQTHH
jgi:N-acyl-D-amino-acid deacylase